MFRVYGLGFRGSACSSVHPWHTRLKKVDIETGATATVDGQNSLKSSIAIECMRVPLHPHLHGPFKLHAICRMPIQSVELIENVMMLAVHRWGYVHPRALFIAAGHGHEPHSALGVLHLDGGDEVHALILALEPAGWVVCVDHEPREIHSDQSRLQTRRRRAAEETPCKDGQEEK